MLARKWYTGATPGKPFFIVPFGYIEEPFDHMKNGLGFTYTDFFFFFKIDYVEANYGLADLERNSDRIEKELTKDPKYLEKQRKKWAAEVRWFFSNGLLEKDLSKFSEEELFDRLEFVGRHINAVIGIAHLIESISIRLERDLRHGIKEKTVPENVNLYFVNLTTPTKPSFALLRDQALFDIRISKGKKRSERVDRFLKTFFWADGGYAGPKQWTKEEILSTAEKIPEVKTPDAKKIQTEKTKVMTKLDFSVKQRNIVEWIDFLTDWQDQRKREILRGVCLLAKFQDELARRYSIPKRDLDYVLPWEISLQSIRNGSLQKKSKKRQKKCLYVKLGNQTTFLDQADAEFFDQQFHSKHDDLETLYGQCASLGTATGPVRVLTTVSSIGSMKDGEVLVTSMTRPEFVPAMRKAVAIVTDEGGITSHAAIVSRELGIPCVIGTKSATKVLKDGWIVQVKANHGQIVVLEKRGKFNA